MRPSKDEVWMSVARRISQLSTCWRRSVGCVLIDVRGHVSSTGYNGVHPHAKHCNEPKTVGVDFKTASFDPKIEIPSGTKTVYPYACDGARLPSGTGLDLCEAIHAEQNALLQCKSPWELATAYITTAPCITCTKLLLATSCQTIFFGEDYQGNAGLKLWIESERAAFLI